MAEKDDAVPDVNRLKGNPNSQRSDFYESRREAELDEDDEPTQKITDEPGGARRDSYFKRRDYE